jgi:hypothetical protein
MAGRLTTRRGAALGLLALAVLLLHLGLGEAVHRQLLQWRDSATTPPPPRLKIAYVREMKPVIVAPPPAAAKPRPRPVPPPSPTPSPTPAPAPTPGLQQETAPEPVAEAASEPASALASAPAASAADAVAQAPEAAASDAAATAAAAAEPGLEWPLSTRLGYTLTGNYRGPVHGDAQVEWARQGRHYQVHLDVSIGPSFAPLITRRMSSDGELGPDGIAPKRYDEETRIVFSARRQASVLFNGDSVTLANGQVEAAPPGAQDAASQFVHLTWLFLTGREPLRAGQIVELPLVLPKRQYRWRYEVLGEQQLDTAMGSLATWHLKPTRVAYGGDLTAEVWLAPSLQYLPVRLLIRQGDESFVDMVLKGPPLQESIVEAPKKEHPP